jgi:hypothetical protein
MDLLVDNIDRLEAKFERIKHALPEEAMIVAKRLCC